jgi:hypothetical protein
MNRFFCPYPLFFFPKDVRTIEVAEAVTLSISSGDYLITAVLSNIGDT